MSPRRVTAAEEHELLDAAHRVERARAELDAELAARDQLIAELIRANARVSDIAEILGLTRKAVRDARDRAETQEPRQPRP